MPEIPAPPHAETADARQLALVGRDGELAHLERCMEQATAGAVRVALIEGSAGIGKTRLAAELLARHADHATCLSARSYRWGNTTSFGTWVEALDRHLRERSPTDIRRLCGPAAADLGALLRSVEPLVAPSRRRPERGGLLEALVGLFGALAGERAVLVVLDDIHLADTSSWEALRYLARHLPSSPVTVVATARSADLRQLPIAVEVLVGLAEDDVLRRVPLGPLDDDALAALAASVLRSVGSGTTGPAATPAAPPPALVQWLRKRTLGNPLFAVHLLRALVDEHGEGQVVEEAPELRRLPVELRERVGLELAGRDPLHRKVLEVLAVADRRVALRDLAAVADTPLPALADAVDALCRSGLVAERGTGAGLRYEVAHPVIQEAVYEATGGARRRWLHRSLARTLVASGELGAAAGHFARSAEPGDGEAVDGLCRAMRQAEDRGLYQEVLTLLAALLDVLPAGDERWLKVLEAMDWRSEWVLGHLAEGRADVAVEAMERIEPVVSATNDPTARGTVKLHLAAFLSFGAGRLSEARRQCERAVERFGAAGDVDGSLLARNELAWIEGCAGDLDRQVCLAADVLRDAEAAGRVRAAIHAAGSHAYGLIRLGRFDEAEAALSASIQQARGERNTYRAAWARNHLAVSLSLRGRLEEGTAAIEEARREDPLAPDAGSLEYLAHIHWLAGRLRACVEQVERSEVRRSMVGARRRAWALAFAARAYADMGHHDRARRRADRARATYEGRPILDWACWCDWVDGVLAWHNQEHGPALVALDRAAGWLHDLGAVACEALVLADRAQVTADAADPARAAAAADRLAQIGALVDSPLHGALARLGRAWSHLAGGAFEEAAEAGDVAARQLGEAGYALLAATALEVKGRALARIDQVSAIDTLSAAAEAFAHCDASWPRDRVLAVLAELGSRGRRAAAGALGPGALSRREREAALLAASGLTAEEAAEQLFIGKRTVETHLANAYAKLGVTSKRELIRRAQELGLQEGAAPSPAPTE